MSRTPAARSRRELHPQGASLPPGQARFQRVHTRESGPPTYAAMRRRRCELALSPLASLTTRPSDPARNPSSGHPMLGPASPAGVDVDDVRVTGQFAGVLRHGSAEGARMRDGLGHRSTIAQAQVLAAETGSPRRTGETVPGGSETPSARWRADSGLSGLTKMTERISARYATAGRVPQRLRAGNQRRLATAWGHSGDLRRVGVPPQAATADERQ